MNALTHAKPLSEERERELMKDATSYVYRSEDSFELNAHCFSPENNDPAALKPAIVFFHGGMWDVSMITQFAPHCMHFASRGMIAIAAEYRVSSNYQSSPEDALEDAQIAMLWLKQNHATLGIDPDRIIVAGAASGAHMAFSLAMLPDVLSHEPYTARPLAVIGLSSLIDTTKKGNEFSRFQDPAWATKRSPSKLIRKALPPSLLVHGKADTIISHDHVVRFTKLMKRKKNNCELIDFEAVNHSFFNFNVSPQHFELTLNSMDAFIVSLGCIEPIDYD